MSGPSGVMGTVIICFSTFVPRSILNISPKEERTDGAVSATNFFGPLVFLFAWISL